MKDCQFHYEVFERVADSEFEVHIQLRTPSGTVLRFYRVNVSMGYGGPSGTLCKSGRGDFYTDSLRDMPYDLLRLIRDQDGLPPLPIHKGGKPAPTLDADDLDKCSLCSTEETENSPLYVKGYAGSLPVAFCDSCYASLESIIYQVKVLEEDVRAEAGSQTM